MEYIHKYHYQPAELAARGELPPLEESPIWLLGHRYDPEVGGLSSAGVCDELRVGGRGRSTTHQHHHDSPLTTQASDQGEAQGQGDEEEGDCGPPTVFTMLHGSERRWASFLTHFRSVVWCTYRAAFPRLGSDSYTSDMGWGCMLRTGQMVLAQTLTRHLLGTEWRRQSDRSSPLYAKMVQWFADDPKQPFSLHRIAHAGLKYGKNVGEWFGPSTMAQVLEELLKEFSPSGLRAYVCQDGCLYLDQLRRTATAAHWPLDEDDDEGQGKSWAPMLIMLPLRLGLDQLNEDYAPVLKETFRIPQSVGISGGKPRASLYFVGNQDDYVFYLDPHTVQPAPRFPEVGDVPASEDVYDTFHCSAPLRLPIRDIDPSLCLAFYCRNREDFDDFCARAIQLSEGPMPIFTVAERMPDYLVRPKPPKHSEKLFSDDEDDVVFI
ncbi:cysteine protease, putative [Acanthamoeba castellanii str. Neff]|uniref:Cysteine protease n=1 Tax=Acanthamoeba castellanii (strain ATCC 30010 / Neff) TaxID=1257118 RepID=L8H1P1_ACACF|nr:cysteine protease, putative [Acanthamoeba castellanii str. Neff]ELR19150.1 cysteine protease, putative [Acanthamoeba castellanii str. Neff]